MKRFILPIILAWLIFIGIDFLFHAAILASFWERDIPAIHGLEELFKLIPFGYLSFLLHTALITYLFNRFFPSKPGFKEVFRFAFIVGGLSALVNFLALYSYVTIPLDMLLLTNLALFIELIAVVYSLYSTMFLQKKRSIITRHLLIFFSLIVISLILQNL